MGVFTTQPFRQGNFLLHYAGDLVDKVEAEKWERKHKKTNWGTFMFSFPMRESTDGKLQHLQGIYRMSQKKFPLLQIRSTKDSSPISMLPISIKTKILKYFCDFSHCLTSTRSIGKFNFIRIHGCKMTAKGPKTLIKTGGLYSHGTIGNGSFTTLKSYKSYGFKQILWAFNPMTIHVLRIL